MRLGLLQKLLLLLLLCGVVPMIAVSALLISIGRHQMEGDVEQIHRLQADAAAASVSQFVQRCRTRLTMDLEGSIQAMSDDDVQKTLVWMLNKQDNLIHFRILRVFDERGVATGDPVRLPEASVPADQRPFYLVQDQDLPEFARHVPLAEALRTGEAQISPVYVNGRRKEALVALAVPIVDRVHQVEAVVAGEVSLREVQRIVSDVSLGTVGFAYLVDVQGRVIAHPQFDLVKDGTVLTGNGIVERALGSRTAESVAFVGDDGVPQLGAHAPVVWTGWQLVVQQPAADAFKPVHDMKVRAAYILMVALLVSVACGALYVRSLVGPLRSVMDGMRRIVEGQFEHRLDASTDDEVGELARAFNAMGRMLAGYRSEIESWNQQLQARVDSKTRALESAQSQLIQTAKLSSLGQLGAGVAHELNNPLAGLVGQAALLKRRLKKLDLAPEDRERLEGYVHHIETESARCREIVHGLLSF